MKLLIIYRGQHRCGNFSTASHLCRLLSDCNTCQLAEISGLSKFANVREFGNPDLVLGIHLFYSGKCLLDLHKAGVIIPYILIVGGTDVNEFYKTTEHKELMTEAVANAFSVVCFSKQLKARCLELFGKDLFVQDTLKVIRPGVLLAPSDPTCSWKSLLNSQISSFPFQKYLILVANIRPVKDLLFVLQTFSDYVSERNVPLALILMGAVIDEDYGRIVLGDIEKFPAVHYIGSLPPAYAHVLIKDSFALLNTSLSEGVSVAILEAMHLKSAVIARNVPGNTSLVSHMETGLLFNTPEEFTGALQLLGDEKLRSKLVKNAYNFVTCYHNAEEEKAAYEKLCSGTLSYNQ